DREQRRQQDEERHVVGDHQVRELVERRYPEGGHEGHEHRAGPGGGDLRKVMMPEGGREQWAEGDREQQAGEREGAPHRERGGDGGGLHGRGFPYGQTASRSRVSSPCLESARAALVNRAIDRSPEEDAR